jgi:tRNA dimethylallyltransferase
LPAMAPPRKYLVVIAGPTAVGKTALAIELAKHYNTSIISADSRQFYRELNIGTAKPSEIQLNEAPHYFINNKSITELYGAGHFERDAMQQIKPLFQTQPLVVLVGGSGLYIDAVLNGVDDFTNVPEEIRRQLNSELEQHGLKRLQDEIQRVDPDYFNSADLQNPQRLVRALEVYRHTGQPYSSFLKKEKSERSFTPIKLLINTDRKTLYEQINTRVDAMMQAGLLEEAIQFKDLRHLNALKTVGYKELYHYLDGEYSLETAVNKIKQHTRNYAKRQLTWFKNKDRFEEFKPTELERIIAYLDQIMIK